MVIFLQTTKYVNEPSPEKLEVTKKIETLAKKWEVLVATNLTKVRTAQIMALIYLPTLIS